MLYDYFTSISYDCKIYIDHMKQKSVNVDMTATTKADAKAIYLHSYGGSVDFSLLEGYPNPGFLPRFFTVEGHIDESISCFLSNHLLQMRISENQKIHDLSFLERAPHLQRLDLNNLPGITTLPLSKLPQLSVLRIRGLHKLTDLEFLAQSNVQYLEIKFSADKVSATRMADVLLRMPSLKILSIGPFSRVQCKKTPIIRRQFEKAGRSDVITLFSLSYLLEEVVGSAEAELPQNLPAAATVIERFCR